MRKFLILITLSLISLVSFAHGGDFVTIDRVIIEETEHEYIYSFHFNNVKERALSDITIELLINGEPLKLLKINNVKKTDLSIERAFSIPKEGFDIEEDVVQIEVTEIYGKRLHWGGWDSPNFTLQKRLAMSRFRHKNDSDTTQKQSNTLLSESYADAPWRMKKTDDNGNINPIPVHGFIHDADKIISVTLQLDYINIRIKNASSSSFGPVLTYNSLSDPAFKSMFSATSPNDPQLEIQEFKNSSFIKSSNYTMDFNEDSDVFGDDFLEVKEPYWYFTFNIPPSDLVGYEDIIDIEFTFSFSNFTISDEVIGLRVFRSNEDVPKLKDWYRGDTHLHSFFTQNSAEIGLPIESTIEAGRLIGLDWFTSTDHTSDYDNYGGGNINTNWNKIQKIVKELNLVNSDFKVIAGQEVATNNAQGDLVHMLAYPSYNSPFNFPFLSDGHGDLTSTSSTIDKVISQLQTSDGFSYAAHPFSTADKLPTIPVGGGIWNLGELTFPSNGQDFPQTGGEIICNETNATSDILSLNENEFIKDRIQGAQIWNVRNGRDVASGSELDPWDTRGNSSAFSVSDTASFSHHVKKFRQGQEIVNHINKLALAQKNSNKDLTNWKLYISAGADAHGSFNYTNTDDFGGFGDLNTNAVGKLTTIVYSPKGLGANGEHVLKSLYNGNSTLSDGPIATIGISDNGNDTQSEILMGDDTIINTLNINDYFFNINYISTNEFGDFVDFKIIAGTEDGEITKTLQLDYSNGSNYLNYSLKDILDTLFEGTTVPDEKYFYIRAELQTLKNYTTQSNLHGSTYDIFHSFTNPIWLKLEEVIEITEFEVNAFPNPFKGDINLTIKNPTNAPVKINFYSDLGQLVSSTQHYVDGVKTIVIPTNQLNLSAGMYTVRASVIKTNTDGSTEELEDTDKIYKID